MTGMMFQLLAMLALIFTMLAQTDAIAVSVTSS